MSYRTLSTEIVKKYIRRRQFQLRLSDFDRPSNDVSQMTQT